MAEVIVGREAELETAEQFLDRIPAGGSALFIEGTPGIRTNPSHGAFGTSSTS